MLSRMCARAHLTKKLAIEQQKRRETKNYREKKTDSNNGSSEIEKALTEYTQQQPTNERTNEEILHVFCLFESNN